MKLYAIGVLIHATAYVKAETSADAERKLKKAKVFGNSIGLSSEDWGIVSDAPFDSPELPDVSLSPVATIGEQESEPEEAEDYSQTLDGEGF